MIRHDLLKQFAGWNDTGWIEDQIEKAFAKGAHVTVKTLRRARSRLVTDGHSGPIDDDEWEATTGYRMPMTRALDIVAEAQQAEMPTMQLHDPDVGFLCGGADECNHTDHAELGETGALFHNEPIEVDRDFWVDWYFDELKPIYGSAWVSRRRVTKR